MTDISTSAPLTRQITSRAVLRSIFEHAPVSRAELARLTGLSKQSMSEIVRDLEDDGWLRVTGRTQGMIGRSAVVERAGHRLAVELPLRAPDLRLPDHRALPGGLLAVPLDRDDVRVVHRAHHVEVLPLAAQLDSEFKNVFPENAVEYFVSYYD